VQGPTLDEDEDLLQQVAEEVPAKSQGSLQQHDAEVIVVSSKQGCLKRRRKRSSQQGENTTQSAKSLKVSDAQKSGEEQLVRYTAQEVSGAHVGGLHRWIPQTLPWSAFLAQLTGCCMQSEEEKGMKVGMGRLLKMNAREWPWILLGIILSAILGTIFPILASILGEIIAALRPDVPASRTLRLSLIFCGLGVANAVFGTIRVRCCAL
jgi:hypothetical protein